MTRRPEDGARWWREPLLHFIVIGALLFLVFNWRSGGPGSNRIVITPGQIDAIIAGFTRTWQRPPTEQELKEQLDEYVREEIATREATALGLDRDDTVIRRRLRQKLEFLAEDTIDAAPPSDADLQAWLDSHRDAYRSEPEVALRQLYLSPDRRGASLEGDARRLAEQLSRSGPEVDVERMGDRIMLPHDIPRTTRSEVARLFGDDFADALLKLDTGRWTGPVRSGYGLHLVFVRERLDRRPLELNEARETVKRDWTAEKQKELKDAAYAKLRVRYSVTVERPKAVTAPFAAAASTEAMPR